MRIIGGSHRGRALSSLGGGDPAAQLRPTTDRVRESLFGMLEGGRFGAPLAGAKVLDLFAGTGALGLEALSRGAAETVFVESGRKAQFVLGRNIATLGEMAKTRLLRRDATRLGTATAPFDLIFLDPPYGRGLGERAVRSALEGGWIAPGALVVWEEAGEPILPQSWTRLEARRFGDSWITLARQEGVSRRSGESGPRGRA